MGRQLRQLLIASALVTSLMTAGTIWTQSTASASTTSCLNNTRLNTITATGSPFGGGTRISWHVTPGCPEVVVSLGGQLGAIGTVHKHPAVTTKYALTARIGTSSRVLGSRTALGGRVVEYGVSGYSFVERPPSGPDATAAAQIGHTITSALSESAKLRMLGRKLEVHIIPAYTTLTSLPPWKYLAGKSTCDDQPPEVMCVDDRPWSEVRGIGGTEATGKNYIATAVGSEELAYVSGHPNQHRLGHILAHELSHVFLQKASTGFRATVQDVLDARGPNADYLGRDSYTRSNIDEYWAEGSAALFRYAYSTTSNSIHEFTPEWLAANDPALLGWLNASYSNR